MNQTKIKIYIMLILLCYTASAAVCGDGIKDAN